MKNYYDILGVTETASQDEIKKAYRKLSKTYHPDVNPDGEEKFKEVSEAYENIGDETKRQEYDHRRKNPFAGGFGDGFNINDLFEQMVNGGRSSRQQKVADKVLSIDITTFESYFGVEKDISYNYSKVCSPCGGNGGDRKVCPTCGGQGQILQKMGSGMFQQIFNVTCSSCQGQGSHITNRCNSCNGQGLINEVEMLKVSIPKNVDNGDFMRVQTKGDYNRVSKLRGDLILKVNLVRNDNFEKSGMDLVYFLELNALQIVTEEKLLIPHPDGALNINMPNKLNSDKPLRLVKKGFRTASGSGDFYIKLTITNNYELDEETKDKLKKLLKVVV
jgi:molecular chaperone DnaJ